MLLSVKTHECAEGELCKHPLFCNFMILNYWAHVRLSDDILCLLP